ncbi:uncharacterized protein GIQ15_00778 [Arthroderma uncinatum]|uniref:uncharacterized protein n=1 Tax=Arthroderma uncinatum TaxID=74035 RepID=UPI00144A9B58|nr:uncharacterized protein GIQ15_00778 [Arthroderma uncinatum]KAF3491261.1 hypothetical protein GIQ15_00778 [Arthroderma uncinatum]
MKSSTLLLGVSSLALTSFAFPTVNQNQNRFEIRDSLADENKPQAIKDAFTHAWKGYLKYAYPLDELKPVSNKGTNPLNGWGATPVDALSTAIIMGLPDVVNAILDHVAKINFSKTDDMCSLFETTIRYLGGMLSGYDLLKDSAMGVDPKKVDVLLKKATELADVLKFAFDTESGVPYNNLNITAQEGDGSTNNGLATTGTLVLEWTRLSDLTKKDEYAKLAQRAEAHLLDPQPKSNEVFPGLIGGSINIKTGKFEGASASWEGGDDSFYEYLIKMYIYDRSAFGKYKDRWVLAAKSTMEKLKSSPIGHPDTTFIGSWSNGALAKSSQHLACFAGGNFILGGRELNRPEFTQFGLKLVDGCHKTYSNTVTKIGPESFGWDVKKVPESQAEFFAKSGFYLNSAGYVLRPEVIESIYYAYRVTGNKKYQRWIWDAFVAINEVTKTDSGFSSISNVNAANGGSKTDSQPSFFFAETMKYVYLAHSEEADWQISRGGKDKFVFNTEAHPFRVLVRLSPADPAETAARGLPHSPIEQGKRPGKSQERGFRPVARVSFSTVNITTLSITMSVVIWGVARRNHITEDGATNDEKKGRGTGYKQGMEGADVDRPTWSRASSRREFLRTYKACMSCRQRKAKCELGGNNDRGIPPGPPCLRCRREQRNCLFSEDRAWARKKKKESGNTSVPEPSTPFATSGQIPGGDGDAEEGNQVSMNQSSHDGFYSVSNAGDMDTPSSSGHHAHNIPGAAAGASNSNTSTASGHTSMHFDPVGRAAPATPANMSSTGSLSPVLTSSTNNNMNRREYRGSSSDRHHHAGAQSNNSHGLHNSVMRTVVSSGNDALNILFQAAAQEQDNNMVDDEPNDHRQSISKEGGADAGDDSNSGPGAGAGTAQDRSYSQQHQKAQSHAGVRAYDTPASTTSYGVSPVSDPATLSHVEPDVLAVWDQCRFVKMGWFSSREAVTYVDMFFKNMAPLSPILTDFYSHHRNHFWLITQEPVLCCTILMISSRYHTLPGVGGASRGFFIHQRLWQHCQHLIMRVMLGQEKGSKAKTRTVGTIEALLVMSEWHPRSLHFPPESDGWDSDLMMDNTTERHDSTSPDSSVSASSRWLEDVIEPARRSDRMSWMLLGSGLTLAHELGIFDTDDSRARSLISSPEMENQGFPLDETISFPRHRIRQLLYVFINQLASRLGCMSLMPQSLNHSVVAPLMQNNSIDEWQTFMNSWIELTKLAKSVTDMFFPSATFTRQQLHSGRYIGLLDHFRPLLSQWRQKHLDTKHLSRPFCDMIFIEYQFVRVYTNSIGMQAVVERVLNESDPDVVMEDVRQANMDEIDYEFIQEVIDGSCSLLQKVISLAESGALRFSPVRIFLRITSSSIFLLKALSLGVRNAKLQESLDILTRSIQALRSSSLDDIHLASRYATLLDSLLSRLRRSFVLSNKNPKVSRTTTRPSSVTPLPKAQNASPANQPPQPSPQQPQQQQQQQQQQLPHPLQQAQMQQYSPSGIPGPVPMNASMDVTNNPVFDDPISSLNDISADDWLSLPFDPSMAPFGDGGNQAWSGFEGANLNFIWNLPS